jgi:hypothetical protein
MIPLDSFTAVRLTQCLLGLGLWLQSVELFLTRRIYGPGGALAGWGDVRWLLGLRSGLALWLVFAAGQGGAGVDAGLLATLLVSSAWLTWRSRGPVCGGSDSMFFQVQLGLFVAALGILDPVLTKLGLGWIAAQSVLSYFLAGLGKLRNAGWRTGAALQHLFASPGPYVLWAGVRPWANSPVLCVALAWSVVLFELAFPLLLVLPGTGKLMFLGAALGFHLANAVVLGLNRFVWAWAATYPALLHFH